jgi:hypothetical protein
LEENFESLDFTRMNGPQTLFGAIGYSIMHTAAMAFLHHGLSPLAAPAPRSPR